MRRLGSVAALAVLLAVSAAGPAAATGKPTTQAPVVTSISIAAAGGSWPSCSVTATIAYRVTGSPVTISVVATRPDWVTAPKNYWARVQKSGTVVISLPAAANFADPMTYKPLGWTWWVQIHNGPAGQFYNWYTTLWVPPGSCPASGVLATGPAGPWPWP